MNPMIIGLIVIAICIIIPIIARKPALILVLLGLLFGISGFVTYMYFKGDGGSWRQLEFLFDNIGHISYSDLQMIKTVALVMAIVGLAMLVLGIIALAAGGKKKKEVHYHQNNYYGEENPVMQPVKTQPEIATKICPNCGERVSVGSRYCPNCSSPMDAPKPQPVKEVVPEEPVRPTVCPNCGAPVGPRGKFCTKCGTKF